MKIGFNSCISVVCGNSKGLVENIIYSYNKTVFKILLPTFRLYSSLTRDRSSAVNTLKIPHWIESLQPKIEIEKVSEEQTEDKPKILKKIRPFRLNQLSVFNPNPYKLSKPIAKNPVLKHLWKLRVHSSYRQDSPKRLVINANVVKHIFQHTDTRFDIILTTRKELIDFFISNPSYRSRYSRIQLVDRYVLQHCLRGTTHSYNSVDTVAEAYIPTENKELSPKFVVALDNVKYTQNIGSLIRTSLALGVDLLYYLKGTTDPFNWKVSSITGGLQYSIPHRFGDLSSLRKFCKEKDLVPVVAHLEGDPLDSLKISGKGVCLILGNESEGPDPETFKFSKRVSLYMHPFTNSLNVSVAGAIIIHQLKSLLANSNS